MNVQQGPLYYINKAGDPPPFTGTIQYRNRQGVNQEITAEQFHAETGARYSPVSTPTPRYKQQLLERGIAIEKMFYSTKFPYATDRTLRLVHMEGEEASVGLGVVAARVIKCGEVICHYNGQYVVEEERGAKYQLGCVNAENFRNLGAMVNHSFPNAKIGGWDHAGFCEWVVVAIDTISEGELVCASYGHNYEPLTLGKRIELRYAEAARFVKEADIGKDGIGSALLNEDKWHYLACNHALLIELYFRGDWSWEKIEYFLQNIAVCRVELPEVFSVACKWLTSGIGGLDKQLQAVKRAQPELHEEVGEYFRQAGRTKSSIGAVYALRMLSCFLVNRPLTRESWPELKSRLDPFVDGWEYITSKRILEGEEFTEKTALHRALSLIVRDPTLVGFSLA